MINISWLTAFFILLIAMVIASLFGIIIGLKWKKKDEYKYKCENMSATVGVNKDGDMALLVVDGILVPHVEFIDLDCLLSEEEEVKEENKK